MREQHQMSLEDLKQYPEFDDDEEFEEQEDLEGVDIDDDLPDEEDSEELQDDPAEEARDLSLDDIFAVDDTADEKMFIPEWNGNISIKALSKNEVDFIRKRSRGKDIRTKSDRNALYERELFVAAVLIGGKNVTRADYQRLLEKNAGVMIRITTRIAERSGLQGDSEEERTARFPRKH
jgi:hypothetical protein